MIKLLYSPSYGKLLGPKSMTGNRLGPLLNDIVKGLGYVPDSKSRNGKLSPTDWLKLFFVIQYGTIPYDAYEFISLHCRKINMTENFIDCTYIRGMHLQ